MERQEKKGGGRGWASDQTHSPNGFITVKIIYIDIKHISLIYITIPTTRIINFKTNLISGLLNKE